MGEGIMHDSLRPSTARVAVISIALCAAVLTGCPGGAPDDCAGYCDLVMDVCADGNALYASEADCLAACDGFPSHGAAGVESGHSLECRITHALAARDQPDMHCPHASVGGGSVCGGWCTVYCDIMARKCDQMGYGDRDACQLSCAAMSSGGAWDTLTGNSVQCRINHAAVAANDMHCEHAFLTGGGICGAACEGYCDQVMSNCTGTLALYPDRDSCLTACAAMPAGGDNASTADNTVQCRAFHGAWPSATDPGMHCAHAAMSGDGVCGQRCDAYCDQVLTNCEGDDALYADRAACLAACGDFPVRSAWATADDSVECRTMHASYPSAVDPAMHCPHAAPDGGGVCEDPEAPRQYVTLEGEVHRLGDHLADNHIGVGGASILAYGVSPTASTTTSSVAATLGRFSLDVPANGRIFLRAAAAGYYATYTDLAIGSSDIGDAHLVLSENGWLGQVATTYGVNIDLVFPCETASLSGQQCIYTVVVGQILDDASTGARRPVAGIGAQDFQVTGDGGETWATWGPYFLNADGTPNASNTTSVVSGSSGGLYVLFTEIPQQTAGYDSAAIEIYIAYDGAGMRYFGPRHTNVFRLTSVTWADVHETGNAPLQPGGDVSFDAQIYPLFLSTAEGGYGCQGCHTNQAGTTPAGGLNLWGGPDVAYAQLDPSTFPNRVNLGSPETSTLLVKPLYQPSGGQNHPIFAWVSTSDPAYRLILQWIQEGAQRAAAPRRVSFVGEVRPLVGHSTAQGGMGCIACHDGGGFNVGGTAAQLYDVLVNQAAADQSGGEAYRVNKQGRPERSLVLTKPLTGVADGHPLKVFESAADWRYQVIYQWVAEGYGFDGYCESYCDDIMQYCTGSNAQYPDRATCIRMCGGTPATGTAGDMYGDSIQCRITHLGAAATDPAVHCSHAGPSGGAFCGDWCTVYCRQIQTYCTGGNAQYDSRSQCLTTCGGLSSDGTYGDLSGNTVQCRLGHLVYAESDPATHCAHSGPEGTGGCE
jgi:hypothetical protein